MKAKGKDLVFISLIKRKGDGVEDVSNKDMSHYDETSFEMNCLSITNETWIASEFNSFVVKMKKKFNLIPSGLAIEK